MIPRRILVIRVGQLGDTVAATGVIEPLRRQYGEDVEIDILVKHEMAGLFQYDSRVKGVYEVRHRHTPIVLSRPRRNLIARSKKWPYDLVMNLETGRAFSPFMEKVAARSKVQAWHLRRPSYERNAHAVSFLRQVLSTCMPSELAELARPSLAFPSQRVSLRRFGIHDDYCVFHPSNSHILSRRGDPRSWPKLHWKALIAMTDKLFPGLQVVLIGTKKEQAFVRSIAAKSNNVVNLCGQTTLNDLMEILLQSRFVVSSDSGPSHLAAALKKPVITLFGPTDPSRVGPWDPGYGLVRVLSTGLPCSPCYGKKDYLTCGHRRCMQGLTPDAVMGAISEVMLHSEALGRDINVQLDPSLYFR